MRRGNLKVRLIIGAAIASIINMKYGRGDELESDDLGVYN